MDEKGGKDGGGFPLPQVKNSEPDTSDQVPWPLGLGKLGWVILIGFVAWALVGVVWLGEETGRALRHVDIIFTPLILALLIVFLLHPLVTWADNRGIGRLAGSLATYALFICGLMLIGVFLAPVIGREVRNFRDELPDLRKDIESWLEDVSTEYDFLEFLAPERLRDTPMRSLLTEEEENGDGEEDAENAETDLDFGLFVEYGGSVLRLLVQIVLAPIIALYLLIDLPHLLRAGRALIPPAARSETEFVLQGVAQILMSFFRGQLVVAAIVATMSVGAFLLVGVPFAVPIGLAGGLFNIIPYVGPWIGGGLAVLVSLVVDDGLSSAFWAVLAAVSVQQIDNHFVSPVVMRRAVKVHPAAVVLGLLAGGELAGFWGLLLAVPAIASFKLMAGYFWRTRILNIPKDVAMAFQARGLGAGIEITLPMVSLDVDASGGAVSGGAVSGDAAQETTPSGGRPARHRDGRAVGEQASDEKGSGGESPGREDDQ